MNSIYPSRDRGIAVVYGLLCHGTFAVGIGAMITGIFSGLRLGRGPFSGTAALAWDLLLVTQSVVLHSFARSARPDTVETC